MTRRFEMADLFCGAGGTSEGAEQALRSMGYTPRITAVNHWEIAVATHKANHPDSDTRCASIDSLNPREMFGKTGLDLLWASPECTHHSVARGGCPINDQSRATAMCVPRWAEALQPGVVLVENVPEFRDWGPLTRGPKPRPIKSRRGETFRAWINMMVSLGYRCDYTILCAADFGDPTTRRRLFVQFVRGKRNIIWPEPTHGENGADLFGNRLPWRPAREIIDWEHKGKSIYSRKRPLADTTMRRIMAGLRKYGLKPFVIGQQSGATPRDVSQPLPTVATSGAISMCQPFIVPLTHHGNDERTIDVNGPLPTVTCANRGEFALVNPYIVEWDQQSSGGGIRSVEDPLSTVCTKARHGVAQPYLVEYHGDTEGAERVRSIEDPLPTVDCSPRFGLAEPYLVELRGTSPRQCEASIRDIQTPLGTVTAGGGHFGLCEPFLVSYYGNGGATSVDEPLPTVTCKDRFGLAHPVIEFRGKRYEVDILFRMLEPSELAGAMGFPANYKFEGKKSDVVRQIGNAVPCGLSRALVASAVSQDAGAARKMAGLL